MRSKEEVVLKFINFTKEVINYKKISSPWMPVGERTR